MMAEKIFNCIYQYVFFLFHYDSIIIKRWPNFYHYQLRGKHFLNRDLPIRICRPFATITMPGLLLIVAITANISFLCDNKLYQKPFWALIRLYPKGYEIYTTCCMILWCLLGIGSLFYGLSNKLSDYRFLWIIHLKKTNFKIHNIAFQDWLKFNKFIQTSFNSITITMIIIWFVLVIALAHRIITDSLLDHSFGWTIFWFCSILFMDLNLSSCK